MGRGQECRKGPGATYGPAMLRSKTSCPAPFAGGAPAPPCKTRRCTQRGGSRGTAGARSARWRAEPPPRACWTWRAGRAEQCGRAPGRRHNNLVSIAIYLPFARSTTAWGDATLLNGFSEQARKRGNQSNRVRASLVPRAPSAWSRAPNGSASSNGPLGLTTGSAACRTSCRAFPVRWAKRTI